MYHEYIHEGVGVELFVVVVFLGGGGGGGGGGWGNHLFSVDIWKEWDLKSSLDLHHLGHCSFQL